MKNYSLYVLDTETSGLDFVKNDVIELSIKRIIDGSQKTWFLKPFNIEAIEESALRINGHKLEDLKHETKFGRETYLDPHQVIIDVENWLMEDNVTAEFRCMVGHNCYFDKNMLEQLWNKCNSKDSFPFGRRVMDTMIFEFMIDYMQKIDSAGYSLSNLCKKYGVKNEKAHSAEFDVKSTAEVLEKQMAELRKKMK